MRDPKRIEKILGNLEAYWKANPDMRFFQVLTDMGWYLPLTKGDQYHQEDDTLL